MQPPAATDHLRRRAEASEQPLQILCVYLRPCSYLLSGDMPAGTPLALLDKA